MFPISLARTDDGGPEPPLVVLCLGCESEQKEHRFDGVQHAPSTMALSRAELAQWRAAGRPHEARVREWELRATRRELSFGMQNRGVFTWLAAPQFLELGGKGGVIRERYCHVSTVAVRVWAASDALLPQRGVASPCAQELTSIWRLLRRTSVEDERPRH